MAPYDPVLPPAAGGSPEAPAVLALPEQGVLQQPEPAAAVPARRPSRRGLVAVALLAATGITVGGLLLSDAVSDQPSAQTWPDLPPGPAIVAAEDLPGPSRLATAAHVIRGVDPLSGDGFEIRVPTVRHTVSDGSRDEGVLLLAALPDGGGMLAFGSLGGAYSSARDVVDLAGPEGGGGPIRASAVASQPAWSRDAPFGGSTTRRVFAFEHDGHAYQIEYLPRRTSAVAGLNSALAAVQTLRWTS
jgi:hypothetical protein